MELDELKKSWNALNEQLQKEPIADEGQISRMIETCRTRNKKSLRHLLGVQRFSLGIGIVFSLFLIVLWIWLPESGLSPDALNKVILTLAFTSVSLAIGIWWDLKTYRWIKSIRIDEMSIVEVSRHMVTLRRWTRNEVMAAGTWILAFNGLMFWVADYHQASFIVQATIWAVYLFWDTLVFYIVYKKIIYKHLNNIKQNIEELKDVCTE